ncbi:MAG: hypothetical protein L0Z50_18670 [Verrucomicrobiales bacterium]|nr:hypothetical protein [Verrucomicrobiales bacterium]
MNAAIEDARAEMRNYLLTQELARVKGILWMMVASKLIEKLGVADDSVFAEVEAEIRERGQSLATVPNAGAILQEAMVEFRCEGRALLR